MIIFLCGPIVPAKGMFATYPGEKLQRIIHKPLGPEPLLNETLHSPLNIHDVGKIFEVEHGVPSKTSNFISTIDIFGLLYISGMRFEQENRERTYVGYIHSLNEALITWTDPRPACITRFQLAQDPRGIRGIAIESAAGGLSNWVGEYVGIPRRRSVPRGSKRDQSYEIALLQCGFDALKLVSLSVALKDETETETQTNPNDEPPEPRDANIWYPEIPDLCLSFKSLPGLLDYRQGQDEMPLSTILFGGLKGELLDHIVKMTVWIADTHPAYCVVRGIGFTFDCLVEGQSSLVLGQRRDDGEYNFPIDGRGGERICQIDSSSDSISQYSWLCNHGFKVHTNNGRTFQFPPTWPRLRFDKDPVSKTIFVEDGTIVGFCSRMSDQITPNAIGLVHIKDPVEELPPLDERYWKHLKSPS